MTEKSIKKQHPSSKPTLYKRVFRSMSGVSVSFILIMLLCSLYIFSQWFFDMHQKDNLKQLQYISQEIDVYLTTVENYSKSIIIDDIVHDHVVKYVKEKEPFTASDQSAISREINRTIQSTSFIHSVTVYSRENKIIASTELRRFPTIIDLDDTYQKTKGIWIESHKYSTKDQSLTKTFSFIRPFWDYLTGSFIGYLEIAVPESSIAEIYQAQATRQSHYYICSKDARIISSDRPEMLEEEIPDVQPILSEGQYKTAANGSIWFSYPYERFHWYLLFEQDLLYYLMPFGQVLFLFFILAIACILVCFVPARHISSHITRPVYRLIEHTNQIKRGNWTPVPDVPYDDYDMQILYESFNSMLTAQEQLKNDLIQAQRNKDKIKLDLLQQQINPHFLYNTLDNICALAELDEKDALIDIVMSLSTFYRKGLSNGKSFVTLKEELTMTESYLHIMAIRYFHKFHYSIICPENLYHCPCLKLLLQPIVENSIYHGIKELSGKGTLTITVTEKGEDLCICVEDNGMGVSPEKIREIFETNSDHFGIKNIHERIQLYYGPKYGLTLTNREEGGCRACIYIGKEIAK